MRNINKAKCKGTVRVEQWLGRARRTTSVVAGQGKETRFLPLYLMVVFFCLADGVLETVDQKRHRVFGVLARQWKDCTENYYRRSMMRWNRLAKWSGRSKIRSTSAGT
ncbi:uncharacterized protein LOC133847014 [Drosophila sulfurigaster albostrigata]|uniref:uncharacterized protein LOC133847014 n=1 Tax=Drosophila sulfurigaster albostrigata TaxID=89887 RepID=UPI002D21DADF|nr:uncharacterized protein LOC133847014 [Drosophila sulfurigaster albostrigata]